MDDLEKLQKQPVSSLIIAVYGNEPGIGTTHISLGLSASLWEMKIANLYEECHPSPHLRRLGKSQGKRADSYGIFRLFGCALKPWYGRQVYFLTHRYPVVVQDRGVWRGEKEIKEMDAGDQKPDVVLLVVGGKWWNASPVQDFLSLWPESGAIIYNFSDKAIGLAEPKGLRGRKILRSPLFANPFKPDKAAREWMAMLWNDVVCRCKGDENPGRKNRERRKHHCRIRKKTSLRKP